MTKRRALLCCLAAACCLASLPVLAAGCRLQVEGGWIRKPPADLPMLAGYARIANPCGQDAEIVSASSPAFTDVTLHATVIEDGISKMRPIPRLRIAAGETAAFQPGGMHLMLMQPTQPLRSGDMVEVVFQLANGRTLRGRFAVKGPKAIP